MAIRLELRADGEGDGKPERVALRFDGDGCARVQLREERGRQEPGATVDENGVREFEPESCGIIRICSLRRS